MKYHIYLKMPHEHIFLCIYAFFSKKMHLYWFAYIWIISFQLNAGLPISPPFYQVLPSKAVFVI